MHSSLMGMLTCYFQMLLLATAFAGEAVAASPKSLPAADNPIRNDTAFRSSRDNLVPLADARIGRHAFILIGGIYGDYRYFMRWLPCLAQPDTMVLGWRTPLQNARMPEAAGKLAAALMELRSHGVSNITLLAHSIGGLLAKGAIDALTRSKRAGHFDNISLHAFGTPWGGFASADLARIMPGGLLVSKLVRHPVWLDLGTGSDFLASLEQAMPANGRLYHYIGDMDSTAMPATSASRQRYLANLAGAASVMLLNRFKHDDYVAVSVDKLLAQASGVVFPGTDNGYDAAAESTGMSLPAGENSGGPSSWK